MYVYRLKYVQKLVLKVEKEKKENYFPPYTFVILNGCSSSKVHLALRSLRTASWEKYCYKQLML